jgi:hypothetical protein
MNRTYGDVDPSEYDWRIQFDIDDDEPYIPMDVGKVRGLALAYDEALRDIVEKDNRIAELVDMLELCATCNMDDVLYEEATSLLAKYGKGE